MYYIVTNKAAPEASQIAGIQMFDWIMSNQDNIDLWLFGMAGKNYQPKENLTYTEVEGVDPASTDRRTW